MLWLNRVVSISTISKLAALSSFADNPSGPDALFLRLLRVVLTFVLLFDISL